MNSVEESYYDSLKFVFDACHSHKQTIFETIRANFYPDFELDINSANLLFSLHQESKGLRVFAVIQNAKQESMHNRVRGFTIFTILSKFPRGVGVSFSDTSNPYEYHEISRIIPRSKKDEWNKKYTKMRKDILRAALRLDRSIKDLSP